MKKLLLLNPPGKKLYIRDLFCSKTSKTHWLNHPVDLVMLSGRLAEKYDLAFIDAIAEGLSPAGCAARIKNLAPDIIVWLTGVVSFDEDIAFMNKLRSTAHPFISISLGDVYFENGPKIMEQNGVIDAVLYDYVSDDILKYLSGDYTGMRNVIYRHNGIVVNNGIKRDTGGEFTLPVPRHDLFIHNRYIFPFIRHRPFATVATDFGCPFKCTFCIIGTLGHKYRPVDNVLDELRTVKKLGAREVFFADQTWGLRRDRAVSLCEGMIREKFRFGWLCFTRVDVVDRDLLILMKRAGCHTVIFGVESASEEILKKYNKCYTTAQIRAAFALAHEAGIETVGTFIMGLPEETKDTFRQTVMFAKEIECDYFSFNVAVPRPGTGLRDAVLNSGLIARSDRNMPMDQAGSFVAMPTTTMSASEVDRMVRRILFDFYLRPGYILKRIAKIKSFYHFYASLLQAWEIVKRITRIR